jgi:hypothetical protein
MKIQKTEDLIEWVDGVYNQCGKWSNCAPSFEFGVMGVGNGISQYNVYDIISRPKSFLGRVSTRDDLCKMLFEVSLRYSIAHIDVNFYQLGENVTFILVLVESPNHGTNIVPEMVDAFLRMFELDKRGRG